MPLGLAKVNFLTKVSVTAEAQVILTRRRPAFYGFAYGVGDGAAGTTTGKFNTALYYSGVSVPNADAVYAYSAPNSTDSTTYSLQHDREWTLEFWVKANDWVNRSTMVFSTNAGSFAFNSMATSNQVQFFTKSGNLQCRLDGASDISLGSVSNNTWYHIAAQCDGAGRVDVWVNGTYKTNNSAYSVVNVVELAYGIGYGPDTNSSIVNANQVVIDEFRLSATQRYPQGTSFTAPTAAFTDDAYTIALMHQESTSQTDDWTYTYDGNTYASDTYGSNVSLCLPFDTNSDKNDKTWQLTGTTSDGAWRTYDAGAATLQTSVTKWSSYGQALEVQQGVGGALQYQLRRATMPSSASGTFVVEGWVKPTNSTSNNNWCLSSADVGGRWLFGFNSSANVSFGAENNVGFGDTNWHHFAIVCDGGTKRFYTDGKYKGAWVSGNTGFTNFHIGQFNNGDSNDFRGYLQDIKITIGSNRGYTGTNSSSANFTVPSEIVTAIN